MSARLFATRDDAWDWLVREQIFGKASRGEKIELLWFAWSQQEHHATHDAMRAALDECLAAIREDDSTDGHL